MIRKGFNFFRLSAVAVAVAASTLALSGCIDENTEDCPPIIVETMVVRAFDIVSGDDITISDRFVDGSIFIFDDNKKLIHYVQVLKPDLGVEKPIPLPEGAKPGDRLWVSAWGNIEGNLGVLGTYDYGWDMSMPFLELLPNGSYMNYWMCPGEIFFGMKEIVLGQPDPGDELTSPVEDPDYVEKILHVIPITQLNARLHITVRGLPPEIPAGSYYFNLEKQSNGYTFEGKPYNDTTTDIRETTQFVGSELITDIPYNLVPTTGVVDAAQLTAETGMMLDLMQLGNTRAGDISLAENVARDINGNYIGLYGGKTTYVLIEPGSGGWGTGDVRVRVEVVPWDEVFQWSEWDN